MKHQSSNFQALTVATRAATACIELANHVQHPFGDVVSQLQRAALSMPLNLTEGAGRQGKARRNFYRIAYGSARETKQIVEILANLNLVDASESEKCLALIDRVCAMCWNLTR